MVKNATGGNKSKKQARSSSSAPQQNIRKAKEEGEIYAAVTKIFGGPNCQVMCNDGISRSCIIRNKFKTRGKRDNSITVGSWILVGIRDWEVRSNGTQKCDLLEVYSHSEKDKLKQIEVCDFNHLNNVADSIADNKYNSKEQLEFSSSVNAYDKIIEDESEESSDDEESSAKQSSDDEQSSAKQSSAKQSSAKQSHIKEDKKKVSVYVPAPVPAPVSLRELMKTKSIQNKEDMLGEKHNDWLTIDDI
jgi:initiation factor 1A